MSTARERAVAWRHRQHAHVCDRIEPWAHGTLVVASDIPTFYDYNLARVEGPDPGIDAEALAAAADVPLAGLAHRRIEVEDEATGARLRAGFDRMGWVNERLAWLHRTDPPPQLAPPAGIELRVEGFEASRSLRDAWRGESVCQDGPEFDPVEEGVAARRGTRAVLGLDGGEPIGFAAYATAEGAAEVELVFCLPDRRGRGLGGALVARALAEAEAAGAREAFILADDEGDSKRLYERLGFRTIWRQHMFTRMPPRG